MPDKFRGVPESFRKNGIFGYKMVLLRVDDTVEAIRNISGTNIEKGTRTKVREIVIEPNGNTRGFTKRVKLGNHEGDFNPKRFRKID